MKWLLAAIALSAIGCRMSATLGPRPAAARPSASIAPAKSLDRRLVGTWVYEDDGDETEMVLRADKTYSEKMGRARFKTGYYEETGKWYVYQGRHLQLVPEKRENRLAKTDKKSRARIKDYEKGMDEGAWKPMPIPIVFVDDDHYYEDLPEVSQPPAYRRIHSK